MPTNRLLSQKKYHRPNSPYRNLNQKSIHWKEYLVAVLFYLWKSLWHIMAIWHTKRSQRFWPTKQTFYLHKTLPRRLDNSLFNPKPQEIGVPQGRILSVILFIIKIYRITPYLPPEINGSLHIDNFVISYSSKNMATIERKMQ